MVDQESLERIIEYVNEVWREEHRAVLDEEIAKALGITLFQAIESTRQLEYDPRLKVEVYEKGPIFARSL
jgi:hypothetical protein